MYQSAAKASPSKQGAVGPVAAGSPLAQRLNASPRAVAQRALAVQLNRGGLPENLRNGVERLSGISMDGVKVHYNSAKPAQLNAEAYAQGRDIHLAPGKAHHLPHEAWHVAQQAQGRVKPTMQLREAVPINDDKRLENEADELGKKAAMLGTVAQRAVPQSPNLNGKPVANCPNYVPMPDITIFNKKDHPRSGFHFGTNTWDDVIANYNPHRNNAGKIVSVETVHGRQEDVHAIQLDHKYSWSNIATNMTIHNVKAAKANKNLVAAKANSGKNNAKASGGVTKNIHKVAGNKQKKQFLFTVADARKYYNDIDNLQPTLGSLNASAGVHGVVGKFKLNAILAPQIGVMREAFVELQDALHNPNNGPIQGQKQTNVTASLQAATGGLVAAKTAANA